MPRILFSSAYSVIEPLGLLHLSGLAKNLGWETKFSLTKNHDFRQLKEDILSYKPEFVGFNIYTGNHLQTFDFIREIKKDIPNLNIVVGGPHPTYFPVEAANYADYVVMSEGFKSLEDILTGKAEKGILSLNKVIPFPMPDRKTLYREYPEYAKSKIKSIIGMTGCPYRCTYCYNSSSPKDIKVTPEIAAKISKALGMSGRLFPYNIRDVVDIIKEAQELKDNWDTDIVYFQDDVHGFDIKDWLPKLAKEWKEKIQIPYHAQMRWEMLHGDSGKKRLDIIKDAGCHGLTLAIESAVPEVRKEVLDRATDSSLMFDGMKEIKERGLKVRTEQITALPYGATTEKTIINLEADLALVELNVNLKPDMAWASTLAPYAGTKLGIYCNDYGFYNEEDNHDVPDTFFDKSVLRFLKEWVGTELIHRKKEDVWLEGEDLEDYRNKNKALRNYFNMFCLVPEGHKLAKRFLDVSDNFSPKSLNYITFQHLRDLNLVDLEFNKDPLHYYYKYIPKRNLLKDRFTKYKREDKPESLILSTSTRHHLYDEVLYSSDTI